MLLVEARSGYNLTDAISAEKGNITAFVLGPVEKEGNVRL
jgi:hypothetical protein